MVGCVDAEQGQAAGQHRPDGFGESQPGTVGGRGFLPTARQHARQQGQRGIGHGDEMPGEPVRGTVLGGGGENAGVVGEGGEGGGGNTLGAFQGPGISHKPEISGIPPQGPGPGVDVPHPEQRIDLPLHEPLLPTPDPVVPGGSQQRPAPGVAPEGEDPVGVTDWHGPHIDGHLGGRTPATIDPHPEDVGPAGLDPFGTGPHGHSLRPQQPPDDLTHDNGPHLTRTVQPHDGPADPLDMPVPPPGPQHLGNEPGTDSPATPLIKTDVDEPGPGKNNVGDPDHPDKTTPQHLGHPQRRLPGRPSQLKGNIGGVVTTPPGPGERHHGPLRYGHTQLPRVDSATHRVQHGAGELYGGHGSSVWEEGAGKATRYPGVPRCDYSPS